MLPCLDSNSAPLEVRNQLPTLEGLEPSYLCSFNEVVLRIECSSESSPFCQKGVCREKLGQLHVPGTLSRLLVFLWGDTLLLATLGQNKMPTIYQKMSIFQSGGTVGFLMSKQCLSRCTKELY